eukprot:CAMPEP_0172184414 /NCGR_PEP_ID=MMETSP1050-20130122/19565_1 /TAXON_ID=233186 /ORGANISM="Cryptomonas curvata, Strain CCAP979/52" /LENGTH=119 /DNA_ID=CAMNT_0012858215 /DNA_START=123 /DNA_END=478 /DNA_ORIENTATION=+
MTKHALASNDIWSGLGGMFDSLLCAARSGEWHPAAVDPPDDPAHFSTRESALESHNHGFKNPPSPIPLGLVPRSSLAGRGGTGTAGTLSPRQDGDGGGGGSGGSGTGVGGGGMQAYNVG